MRIGNHNPHFARELNLISDPALDYSRKAMIPLVQAQERQIEEAKRREREERQGERDYQERQEFIYSLPSAQRAREREDRRWSSYEYGRRMRSLARGR